MKYSLSDLISGKAFRKVRTGGGGKRKYLRRKAFNLIKFKLSDGQTCESISNILDLSENGLQFSCYENLSAGSRMDLRIHFPQKKQDIHIVGRLTWIRPAGTVKGVYIAGIEFEQIADRDLNLIKSLLEQNDE